MWARDAADFGRTDGWIRRERGVRTIRDISSLCSLREDAGKHEGDELASKR